MIIIHLLVGSYYSLTGTGADIWASIANGRGRAETLAVLEQRYDADATLLADAVDDLVERLAEEELLEPAVDGAPAPPSSGPNGQRIPFVGPELEKYTDMQDFLLVDPIHEADATGWPNPNPAA